MTLLRKLKIFTVLFSGLVLAWGFVVLNAPGTADPGCCWVLYCTLEPPIVCWEECRRCPEISQQTTHQPQKRAFGKQ